MIFRPADQAARWEGVAVCAWILLTQLLLVQWIRQRSTDTLLFVLISLLLLSVPILLHVLYRTWVAFTLEYWVDRNAVTVSWANVRQTIPLAELQGLAPAQPAPTVVVPALAAPDLDPREGVVNASAATPPRLIQPAQRVRRVGRSAAFWIDWPAHFVRPRADATGLSLLATRPAADCLLLSTPDARFALSPAAPNDFALAVAERARMGPVANVTLAQARSFDVVRLLGSDRLALVLVLLGLLGGLLLLGALMVRFPSLPDVMAVRYSAEGIPELVREKQALFLLPAIGLMAWFVNGLWGLLLALRQQKPGAYLLWGGTLVVQVCAFFALFGLIGWR